MGNLVETFSELARQSPNSTAFSPVTLESFRQPDIETGFSRHPLSRIDFALAAILFVAALAARSPFIIKGETLLHSDEAIVGIMAQDISELRRFPIFFYGQRYMGALEAYVVAALLPLFQDPIYALRLGPALFFGLLCSLQYLMLTRWFGRKGALVGIAALIAGPPMFMQWSISARGGYIEILVWGTAILWAYSEWFFDAATRRQTVDRVLRRRKFLFGVLAGSGMWINPSIAFFILPILAHHKLSQVCRQTSHTQIFNVLERLFGIMTLPVLLISAILCMNCVWNVQVTEARVQSGILFDVFPRWMSIPIVSGVALIIALRLDFVNRIRAIVLQNASMIAGMILGATPAVVYVLLAAFGSGQLDPALPLGVRPLWRIGETLIYLANGVPLLFGADPRPFETLVSMGNAPTIKPLNIEWSGIVGGANWIVCGAMISLLITYLRQNRKQISNVLRINSIESTPEVILPIGAFTAVALYLLGACSHDFNTIRYLLPIWVYLPGLLAGIWVKGQSTKRVLAMVAALVLSWSTGQLAMATQVGAPHPLRPVAEALQQNHVDGAVSELFDAHILTYLTRQECKLIEHKPFWARLAHLPHSGRAVRSYLVKTRDADPMASWVESVFPGPPPPETQRYLWPKMRSVSNRSRSRIVSRTDYPAGYELFELSEPIDPPPKPLMSTN